ncbi:MAG: tripartite tricarboxylate transporter substrate binding protein [Epulopiscium sp.]|nr:tripartite tricarboxylate transporter substrate binding protein [Candidatus Epulonipiscium sp.]
MKISRKFIMTLMALVLMAALVVGCGNGKSTEEPEANEGNQTEVEDVETDDEPEADVEVGDGKVDYPAKQLTITVPPAAGGGTDLLYRAMAPKIQEYLGVPVVVVNKPGAGCAIGFSAGAKDPADGTSVTAAVAEMLSVPYAAEVDFTYESFDPIANVNSCYGALTVAADAPYDTLEEFIEYAKEHPGEIRIGNSGIGSNWHILAASFAAEAGIDVVHVPFDGAGPAGVALAGGHVEAVPVSPQEVDVHVKSGKAKILATFSPERLPELPDLPTGKELGYGNTILTIYRGFVAPLGTPEDIKQMLDEAFQYALDSPEITKFMEEQNFAKHYLSDDEFLELMEREDKIYGEQFDALGLSK